MTKKREISKETLIRISAVQLIKSNINSQKLSTFRSSLPSEFYPQLIEKLQFFPSKLTYVLTGKSVREYKNLNDLGLFTLDVNRETTWANITVLKNMSYINSFLKYKKEFNNYLLNGKFNLALEKLDHIEREFGVSIWLIKNKIALLQFYESLESQKNYVSYVKDNLEDGTLSKFIVHWLSVRNEDNTVISSFVKRVEKIINSFDEEKQSGFAEYCKYHLLSDEELTPDDYCKILSIEYGISLIDYYEAYIGLLNSFFYSKNEKYISKLRKILIRIHNKLNDNRIEFLNNLVNNTIVQKEENSTKSYDSFLQGNYKDSRQESLMKLRKESDSITDFMLFSFSFVFNNDERKELLNEEKDTSVKISFSQFLFNQVVEVIKDGMVNSLQEIENLKKIKVNFSGLELSSIYDLLKINEYGFKGIESRAYIFKIHPLLYTSFNNFGFLRKFKEKCLESYGETLSVRLLKEKDDESLDYTQNLLIKSISNYKKEEYSESINYAEELSRYTDIDFFRRQAIGIIVFSKFKLGLYKDVVSESVNYYLKDNRLYDFLPFSEVYKVIFPEMEMWEDFFQMIEFPIFIEIYSRYFNSKGKKFIRFAYEDFLKENGLEKPSELLINYESFGRDKVIYFLNRICTESNMDTSEAFESEDEVVSERLNVCRALLKLNPINKEVYEKEIKKLIGRQVLKKNKIEVDQSRIYIDTQKIHDWSVNELEESFNRFQDYLKFGLVNENSTSVDFNEDLKLYTKGIKIPKNETKSLFKYIIDEILSAYLSPEYGLDRFLSTRIRHGILETKLRPALEKFKLITKKRSKNEGYLENEFWINKLLENNHSSDLRKKLNTYFNRLAKNYDNLIWELKFEWVQIYSPEKKKGIFNFTFDDESYNNYFKLLTTETEFDNFIDKVLLGFENNLVIRLIEAREKMLKEARPWAKGLLMDFQRDINQMSGLCYLDEFNAEIARANTEIQNKFIQISEWFVPPSSGSSSPFLIDDAVRVAEEIIKEGCSEFQIDIDLVNDSDFSIQGSLPIFVDIFVNLFDNVVKRSGLEKPKAKVKIEYITVNNEISISKIEVQNDVVLSEDEESFINKLEEKKDKIKQGEYINSVASDNNSGLFKVYKSTKDCHVRGTDIKSTMEFDYIDKKFFVRISIPFNTYTIEENK